jgi:hypothetical protein
MLSPSRPRETSPRPLSKCCRGRCRCRCISRMDAAKKSPNRKGRSEKTLGSEKTHTQIVPQLRPKPDAIASEIRRNCVRIPTQLRENQPQLREKQPQLRGSPAAIASEPRAICVGSAERARFASERNALCVGAQCDVRQCDASPSLDASCRWRAGAAVGSGRRAVLPSHSPAP